MPSASSPSPSAKVQKSRPLKSTTQPMAMSSEPSIMARQRPKRSASAPVGTSKTMAVSA